MESLPKGRASSTVEDRKTYQQSGIIFCSAKAKKILLEKRERRRNGYPPTGPALQPDAFHRGAVAAQLAAQLATGLHARRRVAERRLRVRVGAKG